MIAMKENRRRWLRMLLWSASILGASLGVAAFATYWWWFHPPAKRVAEVVYGHRGQQPLLLDVFCPTHPNGAGIIVMVSGGWKSGADAVHPFLFAPLLHRGYTVFAVRHLSQPSCPVGEIVEDVIRAVRFVRHNYARHGIDPERLGVTGGSSGGHLALMIATCGGPGVADSPDPIDRESSAVQCAACFYPVTDLLNLGTSSENPGDGGPPINFKRGFGPRAETLSEWRILGRELSPIYHVTSSLPPILIVHGDADTLVPLEQSQSFVERAQTMGRTVQLEVRPGKGHGWLTMILDLFPVRRFL